MSELRYCTLKNEWVIIAKSRASRNKAFVFSTKEHDNIDECPFEYGNENQTPSEVYSIRKDGSYPNTKGWSTRVVPNKYHALSIDVEPKFYRDGIYSKANGFGAHEVIIDTPHHQKELHQYSVDEFYNLYISIRERILDLSKDTRVRYIQIFKNSGVLAGATMSHEHTQLIGMGFIPPKIESIIENCRTYYNNTNRNLLLDEVEELKNKKLIIAENDLFIAYSPYASKFAFETRIVPKVKICRFEQSNDYLLKNLSDISLTIFKKLHKALGDFSYNLAIISLPSRNEHIKKDFFHFDNEFFQYYIEILPRLTYIGGYEATAGVFINAIEPEECVAYLKELRI